MKKGVSQHQRNKNEFSKDCGVQDLYYFYLNKTGPVPLCPLD